MYFKLVSVSLAGALALGAGSLAAQTAPIGEGLTALQADGSLVQKAGYDENDHHGWHWRHHRVDDDQRDRGSHWWSRHHASTAKIATTGRVIVMNGPIATTSATTRPKLG